MSKVNQQQEVSAFPMHPNRLGGAPVFVFPENFRGPYISIDQLKSSAPETTKTAGGRRPAPTKQTAKTSAKKAAPLPVPAVPPLKQGQHSLPVPESDQTVFWGNAPQMRHSGQPPVYDVNRDVLFGGSAEGSADDKQEWFDTSRYAGQLGIPTIPTKPKKTAGRGGRRKSKSYSMKRYSRGRKGGLESLAEWATPDDIKSTAGRVRKTTKKVAPSKAKSTRRSPFRLGGGASAKKKSL